MRQIEDIFYTYLDDTVDYILIPFINEIKQKEIIDEYTIFVLYYDHVPSYVKYWKDLDCIILNACFSNGKYIRVDDIVEFNDFKKICEEYELLEKYIKFKYMNNRWYRWYVMCDNLYFGWNGVDPIRFKGKTLSINDFIEEILTNYPEYYKYDYSQIKPAI